MFTSRLDFWSITQAAKAWGVCYNSAKRWFHDHPSAWHVGLVCDERGRYRACKLIRAGTSYDFPPIGNPQFRDRGRQRELIERRWPGCYARKPAPYGHTEPPKVRPRYADQLMSDSW